MSSQWARLASLTGTGGLPLDLELIRRPPLRQLLRIEPLIDYSLGTFDWPNHWEADEAAI